MITDEPVTETKMKKVLRCDKCCKAIRDDYDKKLVRIIAFYKYGDGKAEQEGRYHLCDTCAFDLQYMYDCNRKRIQEGITPQEQEALLMDLFVNNKGKHRKVRSMA